MLDPFGIRGDFPIFDTFRSKGEPLIYLDNAATTQKPAVVLQALERYYTTANANVHRSPHRIGAEATEQFERSRARIASFIGARESAELIFTRGTTESLNLVAGILAQQLLKPGDVILLTPSEHHSNLVPWQMAAERTSAALEFVDLLPDGTLDPDSIRTNWNPATRVFAFQHASNVLGTIYPAGELCRIAAERGAISVVDGAQAVPHSRVDVAALGCDFYAFSGHKMVGPTGVGGLYGRRGMLERFNPIFGGGEMIRKVSRHHSTYADLPHKFEPGTPDISGAIGLAAAVEYLEALGMDSIEEYIADLTQYAFGRLQAVDLLTLYGPVQGRTGAISFNFADVHPHDVASILDSDGIAIRAGHHCAQPLMEWLGVQSTARASIYFYNTRDEIDALVAGFGKVREVFHLGH